MLTKRVTSLFFVMLIASCAWPAQEKTPNLILKVDEAVSGPHGGQKSLSCLRVYSDGKVFYASWWNAAMTIVDEAGGKSRPEHKISVEHQLDKGDVFELSTFFETKALRRLAETFAPPQPPVDYVETISVQISLGKGKPKQISTREFHVALLDEKIRYPAALIVLMEKIDEIEKEASDKGKPTEAPPDCHLSLEKH